MCFRGYHDHLTLRVWRWWIAIFRPLSIGNWVPARVLQQRSLDDPLWQTAHLFSRPISFVLTRPSYPARLGTGDRVVSCGLGTCFVRVARFSGRYTGCPSQLSDVKREKDRFPFAVSVFFADSRYFFSQGRYRDQEIRDSNICIDLLLMNVFYGFIYFCMHLYEQYIL